MTNLYPFFAGLFGLTIGSFLNVVIHRLPLMMERAWAADIAESTGQELPAAPAFNLAIPRSRCPCCGHQIRPSENIPVISWLWLRGKCSACAASISIRYPLIELATAALFVACSARYPDMMQGALAMGLCAALIALSMIDVDTQLLPDDITLPLLWLGLVANAFTVFVPAVDAIIGAAAGYLFFAGIGWAYKILRQRDGMGIGDAKLLAALGAWFGPFALPQIVLIAVLASLAALLFGRIRASEPFPYGPCLATGGIVVLLTTGGGPGWPLH